MKQPATRRYFLQDLQCVLREPAGLVCAALVIAVATVFTRIAAVW